MGLRTLATCCRVILTSSRQRNAIHRLVPLLLITTFATACTRIDGISWGNGQPLVYHQEATLQVDLKKGLFTRGTPDALIEDNGTLVVVRKSRDSIGSGKVRLTFGVIPVRVGHHLEATIRYGANRSGRKRFHLDVQMAAFSGRSNASFLEMIEAPDTSIYGSHITFWDGEVTRFISGHAASNICRKISAAVTDFAISRALINDDFFVGAGFASLPEDTDADARLRKEIASLPHPKTLDETLEGIEILGDIQGAYELADLLDDPKSYKPAQPGAQRFREVLGDGVSEPNSINAHLAEISGWIQAPDSAMALMGGGSQFSHLMGDIATMPSEQRTKLARAIRSYGALLDSDDLLSREVDDVGARSGLVRKRSRSVPSGSPLLAAVSQWSAQSAPGTVGSLESLAIRANAVSDEPSDLSSELSTLLRSLTDTLGEAGSPVDRPGLDDNPRGLVFLPFLNVATGKDLEFEVSKALFIPPTSQTSGSNGSMLDLLRRSVTREMVSNLEDAAGRAQKNYLETVTESLGRIREEFRQAQDPKKWLHEIRTVSYDQVDERNRPTGRKITKHIPNFEFWAERLGFAEEERKLAVVYGQSARRVQESADDPKSIAINNYALLDSFLRGWDLSFVDNSNTSPYRKWLESNRTAVWSEIFRQAAQQGIDVAPLVSDQTLFQVRAEGDHYRIRPMYVGEVADTQVVKSDDGRLLWYRSPWMNRQVVYMQKGDVDERVWSEASEQFDANNPTPALATLAESALGSALAQTDPVKQQAGVRQALGIDPDYTANWLIADYWSRWREPAAVLNEQDVFERILSGKNITVAEERQFVSGDEGVGRFRSYARTRAFEGGLEIMRCLAAAKGSIDAEEVNAEGKAGEEAHSREGEVRAAADKCFGVPSGPEQTALERLGMAPVLAEIRKTLATSSENWKFDALGRSLANQNMDEAVDRIAEPLLKHSGADVRSQPQKRAIEAYIKLEWYSGDFLAALNITLGAVLKQMPTKEVVERAKLLSALQMDLLKALVYSGIEIRSTGEPKFSLAAAGTQATANTHTAYFELPKSDFAMRPTSVDRITYRITLPDGSARPSLADGPSGASEPVAAAIELSSVQSADVLGDTLGMGNAVAGIDTIRTPLGVRKAVWTREGKGVQAASYSDVLDQDGRSLVVKMVTAQNVDGTQMVELLTSAGFEVLEAKHLPEHFQKAVMLAYPDQLLVLIGDDVLRFAPPSGTKSVAEATQAVMTQGHIPLSEAKASGSGVLQEVRYIAKQQLDPTTYWSDLQANPDVLTFSRDGANLRALIRKPDGGLSSVTVENGQFQQASMGLQAIKDLEGFERASLIRRSDERVRFMHVAAFNAAADTTIHLQVGKLEADVPLREYRSVIDRDGKPTPTIDALFPPSQGSDRATVIIYRDAFVRAGGRGGRGNGGDGLPPVTLGGAGGNPPPPPPELRLVSDTRDPDREPMRGVYQPDIEHPAPIQVLLAFKEKYPNQPFALDDALDVARTNALEPILVASSKDIAAYLPAKSFGVSMRGVIINIRHELERAGIHVERSLKALSESNILIISGHKDEALESYIDAQIKAGNLKGKQVVLFSCYQQGDPTLVHRMIGEGGAKEVIFYAEKIDAQAVNAVVKELAHRVSTQDTKPNPGRRLIELLDSSVETVIKRSTTPLPLKDQVKVLRARVPQLSAVQREPAFWLG